MLEVQKARDNLVPELFGDGATARQTQDVVATVEVSPSPVVIGEQVTISGTLTNNQAEDITIQEPSDAIDHGADGQVLDVPPQNVSLSDTVIPANGGSITYSFTYGSNFTNLLSTQTGSIETYFQVLGTPILVGSQSVTVVSEPTGGDGGVDLRLLGGLAAAAIIVIGVARR